MPESQTFWHVGVHLCVRVRVHVQLGQLAMHKQNEHGDIQHGHGQAARTWKSSMGMDMQNGHGHASPTCSIEMEMHGY
jgi:hypothetical protein